MARESLPSNFMCLQFVLDSSGILSFSLRCDVVQACAKSFAVVSHSLSRIVALPMYILEFKSRLLAWYFTEFNDHAHVYLVLQIPIFVSCRSGPLQIWSLLTLHVVYLTRRTSRAPIMPLCCRDHEYNCSRRTHACLFIVNSLFSLIFIIEQIDPAFALGPSRSLYASIT